MVAGQYRVDYLENNRQAIDYYVRQIQTKIMFMNGIYHMTVIMLI